MPKLRVLVLINHPASSLVVVLTPPPPGTLSDSTNTTMTTGPLWMWRLASLRAEAEIIFVASAALKKMTEKKKELPLILPTNIVDFTQLL